MTYIKIVLVDTGANELIRPYTKQWWIDIECQTCKGTNVSTKLAGHITRPGYMTDIGGVMMQEDLKKNDYDIAWILPVSRLQEELNVAVRWRSDGTVGLYFPDGKVVELIQEQGLLPPLALLEGDMLQPLALQGWEPPLIHE